jgi:hypothetical protein
MGGVSAALTYVFGYSLWVMVVLGLLGLAAVVLSAIAGHHGFGGGGNTDLLYLLILRGDSQSFLAAASHYACEKDTKGTPNVYMWDSARGGLQ